MAYAPVYHGSSPSEHVGRLTMIKGPSNWMVEEPFPQRAATKLAPTFRTFPFSRRAKSVDPFPDIRTGVRPPARIELSGTKCLGEL
jgi:hypothetical protein